MAQPVGRADELDDIQPSEEERNKVKDEKAIGKMLPKNKFNFLASITGRFSSSPGKE